MLHLQVDPHSGVPVYRQMMDQVKYYVASGALKPGDPLPSIRDLAQTLRVNPTTVVKAYTELQHDGVIELKHGKGAFIAPHAPKMGEREKEAQLRRQARAFAVEASQLGVPPAVVLRLMKEELEALKGDPKHE
jgi:GntR family transcriptional regulator